MVATASAAAPASPPVGSTGGATDAHGELELTFGQSTVDVQDRDGACHCRCRDEDHCAAAQSGAGTARSRGATGIRGGASPGCDGRLSAGRGEDITWDVVAGGARVGCLRRRVRTHLLEFEHFVVSRTFLVESTVGATVAVGEHSRLECKDSDQGAPVRWAA